MINPEKNVYFLFEKPTKVGISQFIICFFIISIDNIFLLQIPDKLQILILGLSFLMAFSLISYDQTKIFGFHFRFLGLLSSLVGLLFIYSPVVLFYFNINDIFLWILAIILGSILITISILSDYYLIGIPEIVRLINYLYKLLKEIPEILQKTIYSAFKNLYLIIPVLDIILIIYSGTNRKTIFIVSISSVIFIAGIFKVFLKNKTIVEPRIRNHANQAVDKITKIKWKIDSNVNRYHCVSCKKSINVTETTCSSCKIEIATCLICKLPLKEKSVRVKCNECKYQFHKKHWNFWIDFRGSCPNCKTVYKMVIN